MDHQLEKLLRLQQVDGQIAGLLESIAALPGRLETLEHQLQSQKKALEEAEKAVLAEEAKRRRMESDLKDQHHKIAKYREQSSSVKTNEQYHALQHEIGFVEAEIRRIEDTELTSMIQSESLESRRNEARQKIALHAKHIEHEKQVLEVDTVDKRKDLEKLEKERAGLRGSVDAALLEQYDRLARSSRKTALARASGQRCLSCQMALRPQFWNQVRAGTLLNCESCGRLLYFDLASELPPEALTGIA
ncbi:MAG TPA: C4-type zinc ribbon domain-containing protein [Acidobacteriaceae bacterium]|nr:C4-type zinc ribbon domain-containing protein [Acidobacteriaceae bacterium]